MLGGTIGSPAANLAFSFLSPALAIAGAACIAIPIIIHLLTRQRRRPIQWAAMKFLLEAYKKHRRRLTIEQLLLLACRCAVVLLVGLALGRPILGELTASRGPVHLFLLVDNSLLSQVREDRSSTGDAGGALALDRFKQEAVRLLGELDASRGDRAGVIALAGPAEPVVFPPSGDLGAVGRVLAELPGSESRPDLAGALARLRADWSERSSEPAAQEAPARRVVAILSDLRAGGLDLSQPAPSLAGGAGMPRIISLSPAAEGRDNIAITGIEPLRPVLVGNASDGRAGASNPGGNQVRVSLARFGPVTSRGGATRVRLALADGKGLATAVAQPAGGAEAIVQWQPGQETASATLDVQPPENVDVHGLALVARIDADWLGADDVMVRPVESRSAVRVAIVESLKLPSAVNAGIDRFTAGDWIRLVLQPESAGGALRAVSPSGLIPTTIDPASLGRSGLAGFDAAIVLAADELTDDGWRRLREFSTTGGLVVVTPPATATVHVWTDAFIKEFGLDWSISREAVVIEGGAGIVAEVPGGASNPLLGLLAAELPALARPVGITKALTVTAPGGSLVPILNLSTGSPLIAAAPGNTSAAEASAAEHGAVVLMTTAIDLGWTDLPTKPLMLPLAQEIVRLGVGRSQQSFETLAGQSLRAPGGTEELLPVDARAQRLGPISGARSAGAATRMAGVWRAVGKRGSTLSLVGINPDIGASDTSVTDRAQMTVWLGGIAGPERVAILGSDGAMVGDDSQSAGSAVHAGSEDREPISMPLLAAALALALLEVLLARQFSHAARLEGGAASAGRTAA